MTAEALITINGSALTPGQAMTIRVAIETFAIDLADNGLGDDPHGQAMTSGYLKAIQEIRRMMGLWAPHPPSHPLAVNDDGGPDAP